MAAIGYQGSADPRDRTKAVAAVLLVHAGLAAVILTGLNGEVVRRAVDRLVTIDITEPIPPPPPPPRPRPQPAPKKAGAPAKKAEATPVVAPRPRLPVPSPIPAAPVAGTGSSTSQGAGTAGNGIGAGGNGNGRGGGGAGFTPARRISKIPDREYRRLAGTGLKSGAVGVTIKVDSDGSVANCRVARSSGDRAIDQLMCSLTVRYVRFDPARDPTGRAIAQDVTFYPNWWRP